MLLIDNKVQTLLDKGAIIPLLFAIKETISIILGAVGRGDVFTSIDFAYLSVSIHLDFFKYLKFQRRQILYQFVKLPFGLNLPPRLFSKILKFPC